MSSKPPSYISLPTDVADLRTQWPVKITQSTVSAEKIATIVTPQRTFEYRHVDGGFAAAKCEELVRAAELAHEVAPDGY